MSKHPDADPSGHGRHRPGVLHRCGAHGPGVAGAAPARSEEEWRADRAACIADADRGAESLATARDTAVGGARPARVGGGELQRAYDGIYGRCMAARGYDVAGLALAATPAPRPDDAVARMTEALALAPPMDAISASAARHLDPQVQWFRGACPGRTIAVDVRPAMIARDAVTRVVSMTEPHGGSCLGAKAELSYLVQLQSDGWRTLVEGPLAIAEESHAGHHDVVVQGVGRCVRTFAWTSRGYAEASQEAC
jgi:hypothetical protein